MLRKQKNKVLITLLLKEIEEEILIEQVIAKKIHDMFKTRKEEGFF